MESNHHAPLGHKALKLKPRRLPGRSHGAQDMRLPGSLPQGGPEGPPRSLGELALAVSREVAGDSLEVLGGCGFRSPLLFKLGHRRDRRLKRETTLAIGHHLVAPAADLNDLADLQVELLYRSRHAPMVALPAGGVYGSGLALGAATLTAYALSGWLTIVRTA